MLCKRILYFGIIILVPDFYTIELITCWLSYNYNIMTNLYYFFIWVGFSDQIKNMKLVPKMILKSIFLIKKKLFVRWTLSLLSQIICRQCYVIYNLILDIGSDVDGIIRSKTLFKAINFYTLCWFLIFHTLYINWVSSHQIIEEH